MSNLNVHGDGNTINIAGGDISQNVTTNVTTVGTALSHLIDTRASLEKFALTGVYHWLFNIKLNSTNISAPQLHKQYVHFNDNVWTKGVLNFINILTTQPTSNEVKYGHQYNEPNYHLESALTLSKNTIQFEYAQYKSKDLMTNFGGELLPSLLLLYFCQTLYNDSSDIDVEITINATTNGTLYYQENGMGFFKIERSKNTYTMSENKHSVSEKVTDFENTTVIGILEKVVEAYSSVSRTNPFLSINANAQQKSLNDIKETVLKQYKNRVPR